MSQAGPPTGTGAGGGGNKRVSPGFFSNAGTHLKRTFSGSVDPGDALLDDERAPAASDAGSVAYRQLLLWRRSVLFVGFLCLVPTVAVQTVRSVIALDDPQLGPYAGFLFIVVLLNAAFVFGVYRACTTWDLPKLSRRTLFWFWLLGFLAPFLVALYPIRSLAGGGTQQQLILVGMLGGLSFLFELAPKALALMPGLLRAAVTTKLLFPGSTTPGALIAVAAPLYGLIVYVVLVIPYQMSGSPLMLFAMLGFVGAPFFLWRGRDKLLAPTGIDQAKTAVAATRVAYLVCNLGGGLFLLIGLIDLFGDLSFNVLDALLLVVGTLANTLVLGVVAVDAVLGAMARSRALLRRPEDAAAHARHVEQLDAFVVAAGYDAELPAADAPDAPADDSVTPPPPQ